MTKTKKALKWTAIVFALLFIGVPLLVAAINTFDEDLKPEAVAFADFSGEAVAPEHNGYYAWVGLRVPVGENPHARGQLIVAQINDKLDVAPREALDTDSLLGSKALKSTINVTGLCVRDATGCLDRYHAKTTDLEKQVRENKVLLGRYRALYRYPHFHETLKSRYYAPLFYDPGSVASLASAEHALHALRGDPVLALRRLHDDTQFWRRILIDTRGLVGKMIAVATIHRNAQLTSEIVARYPVGQAVLGLATQALLPLTDQERDLTKVYRNEFATNMHVFTTLLAEQRALSATQHSLCATESLSDCVIGKLTMPFLFQPQATINQSFENFKAIASRSKLSAPEFLEQTKESRARDRGGWLSLWRYAYNPIGKIINAIAVAPYDSYTARIHNLDGFLRLVSLSLAAKQQSVRAADMPAFLARAQPNLRNPYTNEPMFWDTNNRTIYFNGMGGSQDEELLSKRIGVHRSP